MHTAERAGLNESPELIAQESAHKKLAVASDKSLNESPELIAQECSVCAGGCRCRPRLNESPELIAQEFYPILSIPLARHASMKVLSLLLRNGRLAIARCPCF